MQQQEAGQQRISFSGKFYLFHVRVRHVDREVLAEAPVRLDHRAARGDELAEQPLDRAGRRRAALLEHLPDKEGARVLVGTRYCIVCCDVLLL